ncbi:hypothetical protein BOTCAL_0036g00290 [Botryotinia calthae]|uniref:Uncharacterized protein n=1 Tax=Botryotinia calthae TaxID=38488 RepID=A0A4Y8DEZ8_9HELO|nr:hypothetical protein BOTCAL_0036g00290 [Botryotinia calthae]
MLAQQVTTVYGKIAVDFGIRTEPAMLLLHVYRVGDGHNYEEHCAIQGTTTNRNYKLGTSILQYSFTMERTPIKQTIKKINRVYITIAITQGENFIPLLDTMANKAFKDAVLHLYYHDTITLKVPSS